MKLEALGHPKTLDFKARLRVSLPTAIGHLELLWAFVAQYTPRGNVGKHPDGAIAAAAGWEGDPAVFVNTLVDAGLIDRSDKHRLLVHDWAHHMPNWVRAKLKKAGETVLSGDISSDVSADLRSDLSTDLSGDSVRLGKAREEKASEKIGARAPITTLKTYVEHCREAGTEPVPPDDPVFRYADRISLPGEFLELAWKVFYDKYIGTEKKQAKWPQKFRNAVEQNWYKLWYLDGEQYALTTAGKQAKLAYGAGARKAAAS